MSDIITQILVEVLKIFGIATKELKRGSASEFPIGCYKNPTKRRTEKFLRKLAGMADLEDALKKLDRLTQEEARMANAEVLRITQNTHDGVKIVDGKVEEVGDKVEGLGDKIDVVGDNVEDVADKVEDLGDKVEEVGDKVGDVGGKVEDVGDKVKCVDDKVKVIIDGTRAMSSQLQNPANAYTFRR